MYSQYLKTFYAVIFLIFGNSCEFDPESLQRASICFDLKAISSLTSNVS
jgi:hypothetical protein